MSAEGRPGNRIGIFGGTFDPVHVGHLIAAQAVHEALALDRTLLVPAGTPPHKEGPVAPGPLRLRMVRAAVEGDPRFQVSDVELRREGPSFTVDTLRSLREASPSARLFLVMGADQWGGFGGWRDPWTILSLADPVVMTRDGEDPTHMDPGLPPAPSGGPPPALHPVTVPRIDLSSSWIREWIRQGRSVRYMIPEGAHRILDASRLYL